MRSIYKTYFISAPVKDVYEAWVDNETIVPPAIKLRINATVGGEYRLVSVMGKESWVMQGFFKEVIPYQKLVYSWQWNNDGHISEITVDFNMTEEGTEITLLHKNLHSEQAVNMHEQGWDSYIEGFRQLILESIQ